MDNAVNHTRRFDMERLALWLHQVKLPLSLAICAATMTGFFLGPQPVSTAAMPLFFGILMLSAGCAALNNYQDRHLDSRYERTCQRPLPSGRIGPKPALGVAVLLIGIGLAELSLTHAAAGFFGFSGMCCYNFLYTPLKRKTIWALLPGVVCGMLPPLIGWVTAGGSPFRLEIVLLMALFAVWQIPHFWLLILSHDDEFSGKAPFKSANRLATMQIERILMVWISCLGTLILCLPLAGLIRTPWIIATLLAITTVMTVSFLYTFLKSGLKSRSQGLFIILNSTVFLCLTLMATDRLSIVFGVLIATQ
ncbi:MAG: UbiA family prenyltransferase [Desulfobacteraceae bacterium]